MRDHPRSARILAYLIDGFAPLTAVCQANFLMRYLTMALESSGYFPELTGILRTQAYVLAAIALSLVGLEVVHRASSMDRARSLGMVATGWAYGPDAAARFAPRLAKNGVAIVGIAIAAAITFACEGGDDAGSLVLAARILDVATAAIVVASIVDAIAIGRDPAASSLGERYAGVVPAAQDLTGAAVRDAFAAASLVAIVSVTVRIASTLESATEVTGSFQLLRSPADLVFFVATSATATAFATGYDGMRERLGDRPRNPLVSALAVVVPFVSFFVLRSWTRRALESLDVPEDEAIRTRTLLDLATTASATTFALSIATLVVNRDTSAEVIATSGMTQIVDPRVHTAIAIAGQLLLAMVLRRLAAVPFEVHRDAPELEEVFA